MRWKMILALFALCAMLFAAGWMALETEKLEQECARLEAEIKLLQSENADLREQQAQLGQRMENWLDEWAVDEFEVTAYTLECGNGDGLTATMTIPQTEHTIAVDPDVVPLGSYVYIPGLGWRCAEDTGAAIKKRAIDIYMGTGPAARGAAMRWGRKNIKVVYQK